MIKLTETMLNKYIIDANESVVDSLRFWVDFGGLKHGQKKCISARFKNGGNTVVCCYLANTRGDRRISIKGLRKPSVYQIDVGAPGVRKCPFLALPP